MVEKSQDHLKSEKKNERITLLISEESKNKWQEFADAKEFTSISKLIRNSVDFYIKNSPRISYFEESNKISHMLKEPLTVINGFSHIILQHHADKVSPDVLIRIKEIYEQSKLLERKIDEIFLNTVDKSQKYDVLLVDDDAPTIMVLKDFFDSYGIICYGVRTGKSCLEEIEKAIPKLILLDIMIPDIDGFELCKIIKAKKEFQRVLIYYITAIPHTEVRKKLKETGADGYILKPFDFSVFNPLLEMLEVDYNRE